MKRRKPTDPIATRYRKAAAALANAEKRLRAAEDSYVTLSQKVKALEKRLAPERLAAIKTGTADAKALAKARAARWKEAERTLLTAATMASRDGANPVVYPYTPAKRKLGLYVHLPERRCLVWHVTRGYLSGRVKGPQHPDWLIDLRPIPDDGMAYLQEAA